MKNQHRLISSLFSAFAVEKERSNPIFKIKQKIFGFLQIFGELKANEILLFGNGLQRSNASIMAVDSLNTRLRVQLILRRLPVKKIESTCAVPLLSAKTILSTDPESPLKFIITGNETLICSAKAGGTRIIAYWANTEEGRRSIINQYRGLARAHIHIKKNMQCIPRILKYEFTENGDALLHVTEILHAQKSERKCADIWGESVRLGAYSTKLFQPSKELSNFPNKLLCNVTAALDGENLAAISRVGSLLTKWRMEREPLKTPIHGDLWHSNALFDPRGNVCGVIDWEWFSEDGIFGFDAFHCLVISYAFLNNQSVFRTIRLIVNKDSSDKRLLDAVQEISTIHLFDHRDVVAILCMVWLMVIYRSHVCTGPRSDAWLSDAIHHTVPAMLKTFENND